MAFLGGGGLLWLSRFCRMRQPKNLIFNNSLLLNLLNGHRETRPGNRTKAYEQAHQLYKAGQKYLGTDEDKFVI